MSNFYLHLFLLFSFKIEGHGIVNGYLKDKDALKVHIF